ncbi:uncharacterized protein RCC_10281 [Ramularia collo-cygni]|uniref:DC-UbP/UBTD2 N-terminal domain-containing protein n=1 Tax=Ramularia collo-cygni TaxID=112498 RepID=A0A2D3V5C2_9PEZI|nr:uncharacterized protein RCC_10281 [Ramularia collo-cygni]CZT24556.1 uncharacterized protein RCC_10281 [Ramularia collo-cygni]
MGCCQSNALRDEDPNAQPAHGIAPQGNNIAAQAAAPSNARPRNGRGANLPNQRIRNPSPVARSPKNVSTMPPPWTRSNLEKQRRDFFDTRVNGSVEIWGGMRQASELLCQGDLAGAQAILDALNMNCPSGKFARGRGRDRNNGGVFDERGALYDIPNWVVSDPLDIVEDAEDKIGIADDSDDALNEDEDAARKREEKGKGRVIDLGEEMKVKVRLSDGTGDQEITFGAKQKAGVIVKKVLEQHGQSVRLLHLGKTIDEKQTLEAQGWQPGTVLNAFMHLQGEPSKAD